MKAEIIKNKTKTYIEISLSSLNGKYKWPILLKQENNNEPIVISDEKQIIANKIINFLNKESNK